MGPILHARLGGSDPLDGISAYPVDLCAGIRAQRGVYRWDELPGLTLTVTPTEIKDHEGNVADVVG